MVDQDKALTLALQAQAAINAIVVILQSPTVVEPETPVEPVTPPANPNLFDLDKVSANKMLNSDGEVVNATGRAISDWIAVDSDTYTVSGTSKEFNSFDNIIFYDENKKFVERVASSTLWGRSPNTITVPAGSKYMRLNMYNGEVLSGQRMINKGSVQSEYQEYRSGGTPPADTTPPVVVPPKPPVVNEPESEFDVVPDAKQPTLRLASFANLEAMLAEADRVGGGANVIIPAGDFELAYTPKNKNIRLFGAGVGKTRLFAKDRGAVLEIRDEAEGLQLNGLSIHGQTIAQFKSGSVEVTSVYCLWVWAKNCKFSNFTTEGAIYDSLYLRKDGDMNFRASNFVIDSSNRNCMTIVKGMNIKLKDGKVRIKKGQYNSPSVDPYGCLYFIDFEPNTVNDKYGDVEFENVLMDNAGSGGFANEEIVVQDNNRGNGNHIGLTLRNITTTATGGARAPYVRVTSKTKLTTIRGIYIYGGEWNNRIIMGPETMVIEDSVIDGATLNKYNQVTYENTFGNGTVIKNVTTVNGNRVSPIRTQGNAKVINVQGHPNVG